MRWFNPLVVTHSFSFFSDPSVNHEAHDTRQKMEHSTGAAAMDYTHRSYQQGIMKCALCRIIRCDIVLTQ